MMWYKAQSVGIRPEQVETTISQHYVYVRRDIVESFDDDGRTVYDYEEQKLTKDDWILYSQLISNDSSLKDIEDAVLEITEIISE